MNVEMLEFGLKVAGVDDVPEILHMRAPYGETVLNPKHRGHVGEIARRFPKTSYAYHPELTRGNAFNSMGAWALYNSYPAVTVGLTAGVVVGTSYVISKTTTDAYATFEPENPNEKKSFWMMLSGAWNLGLF